MDKKDYKNTKEGRLTAARYSDIINLRRPETKHPRMSLLNRAKMFSPFAALRGFDREISKRDLNRK